MNFHLSCRLFIVDKLIQYYFCFKFKSVKIRLIICLRDGILIESNFLEHIIEAFI